VSMHVLQLWVGIPGDDVRAQQVEASQRTEGVRSQIG